MADPICEIFPNDPVCAVAPVEEAPVAVDDGATDEVEEVEEGAEEGAEEGEEMDAEPEVKMEYGAAAATAVADWNRVFDMANFNMLSPMMSNVTFFGVAASWAAYSALEAFRYRSASTYYDHFKLAGDADEYYKLSDTVKFYGGLAIGGILAVTQLLAIFGIAVPLNQTVWMFLGGFGGLILEIAVGVLLFLTKEAFYGKKDDVALKASAPLYIDYFRKEELFSMMRATAGTVAIGTAMEGWMYNGWNFTADEDRTTMMAEWEETIATRAAEVAEARAAMAPAAESEEAEGEDAEEGDAEEGDAAEGDAEEGDATEEVAAEVDAE